MTQHARYTQQGDVRFTQAANYDGGDIEVENGIILMDGGLETAVFLSLFGGNDDDPGGADLSVSWWGNTLETDPAFMYRSETQYLLASLPTTSANLQLLNRAAERDLAWMIDKGAATAISVSTYLASPDRVDYLIEIVAQGTKQSIPFSANWEAVA